MNPYEVLGVDIDATASGIKRAYREKAKAGHPDKGGNTDKMAEVNRAYAILSDPEKRKRYDETGSEKEEDLSGAVHAAFNEVVSRIFFQDQEKNAKEGIELFSKTVEREYANGKEMVKKKRAVFDKAKARIIKAPEFDLMSGLIDQALKGVEDAERQIEKEYEVHKKALELLSGYVFKEPPKDTRQTMSAFWPGTVDRWENRT